MSDAELRRRVLSSLAALQGTLGRHGPDGATVHHGGWIAAVVPSLRDAPLVNTLVLLDAAALAQALAQMKPLYADAQLERWGILLDTTTPGTAAVLTKAGLTPHHAPTTMVADLDNGEANDQQPEPPIPRPISPRLLGALNDVAYVHPDDRMERLIEHLPTGQDAPTRTYALDHDGETASVALTHDHEQDATVSFVATLPWARRNGLARHLLAHVIHQARQRGATTSSLLASTDGKALYERLGYRPVPGIEVWHHHTRRR